MLDMSKRNGAASSREGTAAAVRAAAESGAIPGPATAERPLRRTFSAEYKQRILREADVALASGEEGAIGALLRREGLWSSHLTSWRRLRERGELAGLKAKKRGPKPAPKNPLADENERQRRQIARLEAELEKAKVIIDVQKKLYPFTGRVLDSGREKIPIRRSNPRIPETFGSPSLQRWSWR
jgi:transposase-like protein